MMANLDGRHGLGHGFFVKERTSESETSLLQPEFPPLAALEAFLAILTEHEGKNLGAFVHSGLPDEPAGSLNLSALLGHLRTYLRACEDGRSEKGNDVVYCVGDHRWTPSELLQAKQMERLLQQAIIYTKSQNGDRKEFSVFTAFLAPLLGGGTEILGAGLGLRFWGVSKELTGGLIGLMAGLALTYLFHRRCSQDEWAQLTALATQAEGLQLLPEGSQIRSELPSVSTQSHPFRWALFAGVMVAFGAGLGFERGQGFAGELTGGCIGLILALACALRATRPTLCETRRRGKEAEYSGPGAVPL